MVLAHIPAALLQQCRPLHLSSSLCKVVPKTLKGRSKSAQDWLTRQLNDPYVKRARQQSYRARSAFKLLEIQEKLQLLRPGQGVVECGCAPGAWSQVLVKQCNSVAPDGGKSRDYDESAPAGRVVGVDLLPVAPLPGAVFVTGADLTTPATQARILELLHPYPIDVIVSDMAPNATGCYSLDHTKIMGLVYSAARLAKQHSAEGGCLLCKVWSGPLTNKFREQLSVLYEHVGAVKPPCSRDNTSELYIYARGFKGAQNLPQR